MRDFEPVLWPISSSAGSQTEEILSDVRSLAENLGSTEAAGEWNGAHLIAASPTLEALELRLDGCRREILVDREWPAVLGAWEFARTGKARDLVALDHSWSKIGANTPFFEASFRVGQRQLNRLKYLRDQRVIQRYLAAIEAGTAYGWHPMVYGVVLAIFNLPLRQGLVHFGVQTLTGFAHAVGRHPAIDTEGVSRILQRQADLLPSCLPPLPQAQLFDRPPLKVYTPAP